LLNLMYGMHWIVACNILYMGSEFWHGSVREKSPSPPQRPKHLAY
jgi:hypothetical protein